MQAHWCTCVHIRVYVPANNHSQFVALVPDLWGSERQELLHRLCSVSPSLHSSLRCFLTACRQWVFLSVQWLRLCASTAGSVDIIPGWGTKILYITWHSQKKFSKYIIKNPYGHIGLSSALLQCQSLSRVRLFVIPWITARQAFLSITNSRSSPKLMSIESVMPSNYLILCRPLLLLPSIFPSIRVFSNESAVCIRWPKCWSLSFNISPSSEHPGLIYFSVISFIVHRLSHVQLFSTPWTVAYQASLSFTISARLITSATTLCLNKITFWGPGGWGNSPMTEGLWPGEASQLIH